MKQNLQGITGTSSMRKRKDVLGRGVQMAGGGGGGGGGVVREN